VHRYGWSHSLYIDGEERVQRSYAQTLRAWPWIIHAAEGTTAAATAEFESLEKLGCIGPNTVLVHGIALDAGQRLRIVHARASLVWCPSSNLRLFARTAGIADLLRHGRVALGTDSRLSGGRDLLDEIRTAAGAAPLDADALEALVTRDAARLLRLRDRGNLRAGSRADLLVLPSEVSLQNVRRTDIRLVMLRGRVRFGDREYAERVSPCEEFSDVRLDGRSKVLDARLAARLARARFSEPGLELNQPTWQAA
jgi:cytosine/adenosine deaminase-related metal-dependent hydrolase